MAGNVKAMDERISKQRKAEVREERFIAAVDALEGLPIRAPHPKQGTESFSRAERTIPTVR